MKHDFARDWGHSKYLNSIFYMYTDRPTDGNQEVEIWRAIKYIYIFGITT
jgi:hypothetical protein